MATPMPIRAKVTPLGNKPGMIELQLHGWLGWVPSLQSIPDKYRRIGEAGSGSESIGTESPTTACTCYRLEINKENALATVAAVEALTDEVVKILDDWGRILPRCRIWRAQAVPIRTSGPLVTGAARASHRVQISLDVERLVDG